MLTLILFHDLSIYIAPSSGDVSADDSNQSIFPVHPFILLHRKAYWMYDKVTKTSSNYRSEFVQDAHKKL